MHIAVSWDITEGGLPSRNEISEMMVAVLKPYSWVRPLTTFYIINTDVFGRQRINDGLLAVGQAYPTRVKFLITPVMQGPYLGFVAQNDWPEINERTK